MRQRTATAAVAGSGHLLRRRLLVRRCAECRGPRRRRTAGRSTGVQGCTRLRSRVEEVRCEVLPAERMLLRQSAPLARGSVKVACCPRERCCARSMLPLEQTCVKGRCKCDDPKKKAMWEGLLQQGPALLRRQALLQGEGRTCCGIDCCDPKTELICCKQGTGLEVLPEGTDLLRQGVLRRRGTFA